MSVADCLGDPTPAKPLDAEAARADTRDRLARERIARNTPVLVAVRAGGREATRARAGSQLGVGRSLAEPGGEHPHKGGDDRDNRRHAQWAGPARCRIERAAARRERGSSGRDDDEPAEGNSAVARRIVPLERGYV